MIKNIKVLYYVDSDDNTKGNLMAFPSEKDLRNTETIEQIGQVLHEANFGDKIGICNSVAWEVVYNGIAELTCQMGNYEFGWEETELYP
jgi:hypothetical protein